MIVLLSPGFSVLTQKVCKESIPFSHWNFHIESKEGHPIFRNYVPPMISKSICLLLSSHFYLRLFASNRRLCSAARIFRDRSSSFTASLLSHHSDSRKGSTASSANPMSRVDVLSNYLLFLLTQKDESTLRVEQMQISSSQFLERQKSTDPNGRMYFLLLSPRSFSALLFAVVGLAT